MKIRKGGITRNINENRWHEYSEKGYKIVPENKQPETAEAEPETDEDFEKMTVAELKAYAEYNNIDLGEATKKADILKVITGRVW